ncbi:MAG: hypothetical protein F6K55_25875 [Moorea sp. SIO4A3]|nr:hypothetical protein [Moorena sp. SIO4A3]
MALPTNQGVTDPPPSTFNLQPSTKPPSTFNLQPPTFNLQPPTFNQLTSNLKTFYFRQ